MNHPASEICKACKSSSFVKITHHGNRQTVHLHLHATFGLEDYTYIAGLLLKATLNGA